MAQAQPEEKPTEDSREKETMKDTITQGSDDSSSGAGANGVSFKFNAQAPEFVPRSHTQMPMSGYFYPYFRYLGGSTSGSDWFFVGDQEPAAFFISNPSVSLPYAKSSSSKSILSDDLRQKIIKQVHSPLLSSLISFLGCVWHDTTYETVRLLRAYLMQNGNPLTCLVCPFGIA